MAESTESSIRTSFEHFAQICEGSSPLYAALSRRIAGEPAVAALAAGGQPGQPPPNLLLGAVHFLLLGGLDHPLAEFYPSVNGHEPAAESGGAWPAFADFCRRYRSAITDLVATRRVQTNEVGRCGVLMPAFALAFEIGARPLHLIEVGSSAGLNLLFDRYRYEYSDGRSLGGNSTVVIRTEVRGPMRLSLPDSLPEVSGRVGIDVAPVDVRDDDAMRWLEALIWPDQLDRIRTHRAARELARGDPPRLVCGDGLMLVPDQVLHVPLPSMPCVFHSHSIYQMDDGWRRLFNERLDELGRARDLAHVALEWLKDDPCPQLHLSMWSKGQRNSMHLAECDHHGRWIRPLARA